VCTNKPFVEVLWCDGNWRTLGRGMEQLKQYDKPPKTKRKFCPKREFFPLFFLPFQINIHQGRWRPDNSRNFKSFEGPVLYCRDRRKFPDFYLNELVIQEIRNRVSVIFQNFLFHLL
jgi:hypothetical protein